MLLPGMAGDSAVVHKYDAFCDGDTLVLARSNCPCSSALTIVGFGGDGSLVVFGRCLQVAAPIAVTTASSEIIGSQLL